MSKKCLRLAKSFIKAQGGIVTSEPGPCKAVLHRRTTLEWHAPEDAPMDGACCLIFYRGALYKAFYDGAEWDTFSINGVACLRLEEIDAWAYAPTAEEVLG